MSDQDDERWTSAGRVGDLTEGGAKVITSTGCPVRALFLAEGDYYAIDDVCSHGKSSLSEGFVEGTSIECVLHGALFDLRTGEALTMPATIPVNTYPVRVSDGEIFVRDRPHDS
ncbi:non-heme iron oxygenase ferredoxin subunit [Pseudonocardia sp. NPDC049635]|uniref:non-heme iron oxygenase ferredoxin subunit n=1 Tax=Pseudonocardia sp. NPDC049635 TaxID=3155506 RepID=UPI0033D5493C